MSRYIDAADLIQTFMDIGYPDDGVIVGIVAAKATENVVVPVRCAECRNWARPREDKATCFVWSQKGKVRTRADMWCCYGKRKEPK